MKLLSATAVLSLVTAPGLVALPSRALAVSLASGELAESLISKIADNNQGRELVNIAPGESALIDLGPAYGSGRAPAASDLSDTKRYYEAGQYFKAARYAFDVAQSDASRAAEAYSWVTISLARANMWHSASYFYVRTLQSGDKTAIRRVLGQSEGMLIHVGPDILRKYLIRHTKYEDYDGANRSAYLYALGKDATLTGDFERAIGYMNSVQSTSPLYPYALQIRGTARAIANKTELALKDFETCAEQAPLTAERLAERSESEARSRRLRGELDDLRNRCQASYARTLYQVERFEEADLAWDRIPKSSYVWPDILFEQAWNSFARREYNRTLGKLVTYRSPALAFVFNSEVDVLRSQTFLMLCLYSDANAAINEFNTKYTKLGEEMKKFVEKNAGLLPNFFELGKATLAASPYGQDDFHRVVNRFIRAPSFRGFVEDEREVLAEAATIRRFNLSQPGVSHKGMSGFPGFLGEVLKWRSRTIRILGGAFVKNSMIDYHTVLIGDFEKMAFIKLEMLGRAKEKLLTEKPAAAERDRGNVTPIRRDDQYFWTFNGEFWNDELGDYVFGLESECTGGGEAEHASSIPALPTGPRGRLEAMMLRLNRGVPASAAAARARSAESVAAARAVKGGS